MGKIRKIITVLLSMVLFLPAAGCENPASKDGYEGQYRVAMITDAADITDQSFNQSTYEACNSWCLEHGIPFTYKKPDGATNYARVAMVDVAVAEGYNIIVMPGFAFGETLVDVTYKYPEVKFIALDMTAGDIIAAAVGNKYYENPDAYTASDYYNTANTYCAVYKEEIPGFMAGYAAVRLGYRKLGYLGGQAVPAVMRFGYGFLQGIEAAASELGVTDEISVQYAYAGQFFGSTEITAAMDTWFSRGTEVVFSCGGSIYASVAEAAAKWRRKVIGVDTDMSGIINAYGKDMTVTSAMKSLKATVYAMLDAIIITDTWDEHVGKIENLGLVSGTETERNFVGLPEDTTQWNEDFTVEDYHDLVRKIFEGEITIDNSIDHVPNVSYRLSIREGTIM